MSGFLGCGELFYNRKVNGVSQGLVRFGNATKLEIKENSETKQRISKQCNSYGSALNSVSIAQPPQISLMVDDIDTDNLALLFRGTTETMSQSGATITAEAKTVTKLGTMVRTDNANISSVAVKSVGGATTYVDGTDYEVINASVGLIEIKSTGSITVGDIEIDYTAAAVTSDLVKGGTDQDVKVALLMVGTNLADQTSVQVEIHESVLSSESGLDFLSDEFASAEFSGTANVDSVKGNAYEIQTTIVNS